MASSLGLLPDPAINLKPGCPYYAGELPFAVVTLLGDESKILCSDFMGRTSLYDADSHSVMTVPNLMAPKGRGSFPISITRAAADGSPAAAGQRDSLYIMDRNLHSDFRDECFEELSYKGGQDLLSVQDMFHGWCTLPPPADELPDIDAHTVVGNSAIYVSSTTPSVGTYAFDTESCNWCHAGKWSLPFSGKAEYVPELNLWFGLSASRPFHLCAYDLSAVDFERPPEARHTWVDLDMPKSWWPFQMDLINLGAGRFCVVKIFGNTLPHFSEDEDGDEAVDCRDVIHSDFAVLTGLEVVRCDDEASSPGKLRMLKHMSKYHVFEDHSIKLVV